MTEVLLRYKINEGWGVFVALIHYGENDEGLPDEGIADLEVGIARIAADTVKMIGHVPSVPIDDGEWDMYVPVANFVAGLPVANNDSHDARSHWFADEDSAREHARSVADQWANPLPWQAFIQTD